jgi:peptide/nickel transport system ATP-binding protein
VPQLEVGTSSRRRLRVLGPPPSRPAAGCPFQARCPRRLGPICDTQAPPWREAADGTRILCHIPLPDLTARQQG